MSSEDSAADTLREAFGETDFEMVDVTDTLEVPVSTSATLGYADASVVTKAAAEAAFDSDGFALIAPYIKGDGRDFYLDSKLLVSETNEFAHIKLVSDAVHIYPKDDNMSFRTFEAIVEQLERALDTELVPKGG